MNNIRDCSRVTMVVVVACFRWVGSRAGSQARVFHEKMLFDL